LNHESAGQKTEQKVDMRPVYRPAVAQSNRVRLLRMLQKGSSLQITLLGPTENSKAAAVHFFFAGDVVTVELERRHGQDGVMRVRVAGKAFVRDMTGLPRDGMLYPAVCLWSKEQSCTMVAAP
jgi:hypothetical protein